jgi:hypothetical protein
MHPDYRDKLCRAHTGAITNIGQSVGNQAFQPVSKVLVTLQESTSKCQIFRISKPYIQLNFRQPKYHIYEMD